MRAEYCFSHYNDEPNISNSEFESRVLEMDIFSNNKFKKKKY